MIDFIYVFDVVDWIVFGIGAVWLLLLLGVFIISDRGPHDDYD